MSKVIFGFDVGLGSLGLAVRKGEKVIHADSLLIDAEVATIKDQAEKRRQKRTRDTHQAREKWWQKIWEMIGKEPLKGIQLEKINGEWQKTADGDKKLEREFPEDGDETVYTSCLLRIKLLQGEKLADWQIYKAIRSAFRKAGYPNVPWAKKQEDKDEEARTIEFKKQLSEIFSAENLHFPCYWDAYQMGLVNAQGKIINIRQNNQANPAKGVTTSRSLVEKELRELLSQAAKQIPELKNKISAEIPAGKDWRDYVLFGPELTPFNDTKIEGIIDQKRARFDNRCVNHCCVIPRFKAIRAKNILYFQVSFLLGLCRLQVLKNGTHQPLTAEERKELFEKAQEEKKKYMSDFHQLKNSDAQKYNQGIDHEKIALKYKITKTQLKKWCETKGYQTKPGNDELAKPNYLGRCRYSKLALVLLRDLILSGKGAEDFRQTVLKEGLEKYGVGKNKQTVLKESDLDFLIKIGNDPQNIFVPSLSLRDKFLDDKGDLDKAVYRLLGSTRHAIVRHRLAVFFEQLKKLEAEFGTPDQVVIEFAREDFTTKQGKQKYESDSKKNNELFEKAKSELLSKFGIDYRQQSEKLVRKYMMWTKQGGVCPFTGENLSVSNLSSYEIEHVIPQGGSWQGPDDIKNTVLTTRETNAQKGNRMPFEFIAESEWASFKARVNNMSISGKTKNILLARSKDEAESLIDRYYGLATTGWVALMARDMICLWFGWQPGAEGESRKLHTVSGSLVGKVRRNFGLNKALNPFLTEEDQKKDLKNRNDKRHHALDAMVMTYLDEYMRNPRQFNKLKEDLGEIFQKLGGVRYFEEKLKDVMPYKVARNKAKLGETAYRVIEKQDKVIKRKKKVIQKERILVGRVPLIKQTPSGKDDGIIDSKNIIDKSIQRTVEEFLATKPSKEEQIEWAKNLRGKNGASIKKVMVKKGSPDNLENLSKNKQSRGQYYESKSLTGTGTLQHGMYLFSRDGESWKVRPVYAFLSPFKVKQELLAQGYYIKDDALFYAGCLIEITSPIQELDINAGVHTMVSLNEQGFMMLEDSKNNPVRTNEKGKAIPIGLAKLEDNFRFIR